MPTLPKQYSGAVTVAKAIVGGVGVGSVGILANWLIDALTTGDFALNAEQAAAMTALAAAIWVAAKNYAKVKLGWNWIPAILCVAMLSSCNTVGPAISGKTEINTQFSDVLGPDGSQNTQYHQTLKAPAGVEVKDLASMTYDWDGDGSGNIAVSSDRSADTMGQAELLKAAFEANSRQVDMLFQALLGLGNLASPLIGQKIGVDAAARATEENNQALLRAQLIELLRDPQVLNAIRSVRPARPAPPEPPAVTPPSAQPPVLPALPAPAPEPEPPSAPTPLEDATPGPVEGNPPRLPGGIPLPVEP